MTKKQQLKQQELVQLSNDIKHWGNLLGFQQVGISSIKLSQAEERLQTWLKRGFHGEMHYMEKHGHKRSRPGYLIPDTLSIISVRMDYGPQQPFNWQTMLANPNNAYVSCYAWGRDYHKLMRKRLKRLAEKIQQQLDFQYRVFVDSAPVLEKPIAEQAGLGWIGKHTNLINRHAGSWFFLGEIYTNLALPVDQAVNCHCGSCTKCIDICPTQAIVAPYLLDARRCISYLTIELHGAIPLEFRHKMGNRIYGCDDCQAICPWNKYAKKTAEPDFQARHQLNSTTLLQLLNWTEDEFLKNTEGSAIRRIGYQRWLRNIAVAIGNADYSEPLLIALRKKLARSSDLVQEHIAWAIEQLQTKKSTAK